MQQNWSFRYSLKPRRVDTVSLPKQSTVEQLLRHVQQEHQGTRLTTIWCRGFTLPLGDTLLSWVQPKDILVINDGSPPHKAITKAPANRVNLTQKPSQKTKSFKKSKASNSATYTVFTNLSAKSMLAGDTITISDDYHYLDTLKTVKTLVENLGFEHHNLSLFLPGGVPFLNGSLSSWMKACGGFTKRHIYCVATRVRTTLLKQEVEEVADFHSPLMQAFLSPLHDHDSPEQLGQMAALLGYFAHEGPMTEKILLILARVTRFAPLVCSIFRMMEGEKITGLDIVSITGVLPTLFKSMLGKDVTTGYVLENVLKLTSVLTTLPRPDYLKLFALTWNDGEQKGPIVEYCEQTGQASHIVIWLKDTTEPDFEGENVVLCDSEWEDVFLWRPALKPFSIATARSLYSTAILQGANNPLLFLGHVDRKHESIQYIDPATAQTYVRSIEEMVKEVGDNSIDDTRSMESGHMTQVMEILFDASSSMRNLLDPRVESVTRERAAKEFLQAFVTRTLAYRVASILGIISFASSVTECSALSPLASDFESGISGITPSGSTHLWDAIASASGKLDSYNHVGDSAGGKVAVHRNACQRIVVLSDGEDYTSKVKPWDALNVCLRQGTIVDSVLLSVNTENKALALFCRLTGGVTLRASALDQGLDMFEQEAFLNNRIRRRSPAFSGEVTEEIWEEELARLPETYIGEVGNCEIYEARQSFQLASPRYIGHLAQTELPGTQREIRVVCELRYVANHCGPDVSVWVHKWAWDNWRVFIKGPAGTPYEKKWWSLYVMFPPGYPVSPPGFRFLSVPLHPNVSQEGRLLFSNIDEQYTSSMRVYDIILQIRELFSKPELESPLNYRVAAKYGTAGFDKMARDVTNSEAKDRILDYPYVRPGEDPAELPEIQLDDTIQSQVLLTQQFTAQAHPIIVDDCDML